MLVEAPATPTAEEVPAVVMNQVAEEVEGEDAEVAAAEERDTHANNIQRPGVLSREAPMV